MQKAKPPLTLKVDFFKIGRTPSLAYRLLNPLLAMNKISNALGNTHQHKPTTEQIAAVAYEIYIENGRQDGHDFENWICAEKLLTEIAAETSVSSDPHPARKAASLTSDVHPVAPREHPLARDERGSASRAEIRQQTPRRPSTRR